MNWENLPEATTADLERDGAAFVLLRPAEEVNPQTGQEMAVEAMRVSFPTLVAALRERLAE